MEKVEEKQLEDSKIEELNGFIKYWKKKLKTSF